MNIPVERIIKFRIYTADFLQHDLTLIIQNSKFDLILTQIFISLLH